LLLFVFYNHNIIFRYIKSNNLFKVHKYKGKHDHTFPGQYLCALVCKSKRIHGSQNTSSFLMEPVIKWSLSIASGLKTGTHIKIRGPQAITGIYLSNAKIYRFILYAVYRRKLICNFRHLLSVMELLIMFSVIYHILLLN